jgi:tetratricopeptide (TPR) repeat protein
MQFLARNFAATGKSDEIENLYRDRLKRCHEELGEDTPRTINAMNMLADCLMNRGKFVEGSRKYEEWVELNARRYGDLHMMTLDAAAVAAETLWYSGMRGEALEHASISFSGWRQRVESTEAGAPDYNGYARFLLTCQPPELRDPERALELAMKANEMSEEENHMILDTLAMAYHLNEDTEQALKIQKKAVALISPTDRRRERRPLEDYLIRYLLHTGDVQAAEQILDERAALNRERHDGVFLDRTGSLLDEALILIDECRYQMAEPRVRESMAVATKSHNGRAFLSIQEARSLLGKCLAGQGRFDEAEDLLLEGYEGMKDHPMVPIKNQQRVLDWIIKLYEDRGNQEEAAKWRAKLR